MKAVPQVQKYMSTTPHAINGECTVEEAMKVMRRHDVRHLPVIGLSKGFGIISDRDLKYASSLAGFNPRLSKVADICETDPYITVPSAPINAVGAELAERRAGSALIMDNGHLVGIFTTTDACRALSEVWGHQ